MKASSSAGVLAMTTMPSFASLSLSCGASSVRRISRFSCSTIAGGVLALIENPSAMARLQREPELIPDAAEEMVRWVSPVKHFFRTAAVDYEIRGKTIKAGDSLFISFPSGNRDEEAFDRPFEFDITRRPNEHVGFGGGGPHHCLGANLARMEIRLLLEEMAQRMPEIELTGEPAPLRSNFIAGIKHMPVKFPAGKRTAT